MRAFAVTWAYRCPFARNFTEHVLTGLAAGAPWEVTWVPFSLHQMHIAEDEPDVWDDPNKAPLLLAMQAGVAVRDRLPESFLAAHSALFAARHDEGLDLRQEHVLRQVLVRNNVDADAVFEEVASGAPRQTYRREHERCVAEHGVFGVPTLIAGGRAVFVRLMHGPAGDPASARRTVETLLDLIVGCPELNEFKHTTIPGSTR
jgi:protein-disulfide isomerase-like protein with CxxC motif